MSEILTLDDENLDEVARRVAAILDDGRLVVVPADSMYGVLANPFHPHGSDRVYAARAAPRTAPLPVLVHTSKQLPAFAEVSPAAERLMAACWPGPLTLLLAAVESMAWDLGESAGTVAVRMPAEALLLRVLASTGPLACTAASRAGERAPTTMEQAMASLGGEIALYVDAGPREAPPSTVVDVSRGGAEVRRRGGVSADDVFTAASEPPPEAEPEAETAVATTPALEPDAAEPDADPAAPAPAPEPPTT